MNRFFFIILLFCFSIKSQAQFTLSDSLKAYYPFYGDASDLSGNGNNAVVIGATPAADRFGNSGLAFEFDGVDDHINTFTTFDYEFRSISLWAKPYDIQGNGSTEKHVLGQDDWTLNYGQVQIKFSLGNIELRAGGESNHQIQIVNDSTWYHIVVIRDGIECRYYLNNILLGVSSSGSLASSITPNPLLVIGAGRTLGNQFFNGLIDDVRIYNRALTFTDVDSLYNENNPILALDGDNFDQSKLNVFPNPFTNVLNIQLLNEEISAIKIFSTDGKAVYEKLNVSSKNFDLNIDLKPGFYVMEVHSENGKYFTKIMRN